ncbi:MAG: hypothetical protein HY271_15935 [Deltaproteobacteria bacterium]|nr:hypothetical protein [Deltaproteobacteria bacterium]
MGTDIHAARRGLLKFIAKQGGSIPMRELHTHSLVFYQAGHQAFSQIMEGLVADALVAFDEGVFLLTDKGRAALDREEGEER